MPAGISHHDSYLTTTSSLSRAKSLMRGQLIFGAGIALVAAGCSFGSIESSRTETRSFAPGNLETVRVETFNGSVEVVGHDSSEVEVEIEYTGRGSSMEEAAARCEELDCAAVSEEGLLTLKAEKPAGDYSSAVSLVLRIPRYSAIHVTTSNGAVTIEDAQNGAEVQTSNGRVMMNGVEGAIVAKSSNGAIRVERCIGSVDLTSSNGQIEFEGELTGTSNQFSTSNGSVRARISEESIVEVRADTANGSINCDAHHVVLDEDKDSLHALVGRDATDASTAFEKLTIETSNGSITISSASNVTAEANEEPEMDPSEDSDDEN